jgi:glycosyltransferase involved in cell wall biosynthesis
VAPDTSAAAPPVDRTGRSSARILRGRRAAVLLFSYYPADPRPRRAAEALTAEGMSVDVICLRRDGRERLRDSHNGVSILRLPLRRRRGGPLAYILQYAVFILACAAVLGIRSLRRRYALVHVHNMPDALVFSALIPKALGAKVVLDLHDPMPELMRSMVPSRLSGFVVRQLERIECRSIRFADLVFTVNIACRRLFTSRGCPPEKIHVIMNSPDEQIFTLRSPARRPAVRRTPFVVMYHGSMVDRNGLDLAIEAMPIVRRDVPEAELRIYGDSTPFLEQLMLQVRDNGLQDAIRYYGGRTLDGIVDAIDDCDVGIIPNRRTTFTEINTPTRIFEYLARGKPVVAGRGAGVLDYFPDDALVFFTLGDVADLARAIVRVFQHPADGERVVTNGQHIYAQYRWSGQRAFLVERLLTLLNAPSPGALALGSARPAR